MLHLVIDATSPAVESIERAAQAIRSGGLVVVPTDTLYGLAADPFRADAVARVFAVKGRTAERALPLIAADARQVMQYFGTLAPLADRLAKRFWPGPMTLLVAAPPTLAAGVTGGTGTVGVRVPDHAVARALCRACEHPVTATSANVSGAPASADPGTVAHTLGTRIDVLLDAGPTSGGPPSTIVDVTGEIPRLVRAGAIRWEEVQECVDRG